MVLLPNMLTFVVLGAWLLLGKGPAERVASRLVSLSFSLASVAALSLVAIFELELDRETGGPAFLMPSRAPQAQFVPLSFRVDRLSAPMMALTAGVCFTIARFSSTYLVGQRGQPRFCLLLTTFGIGMFCLVMAGNEETLIAGWEVVGVASTLLIAFFHER